METYGNLWKPTKKTMETLSKFVKTYFALFSDPLGPAPERPRTSAGRNLADVDEFEDEDVDDLLPE